MKRIYPHHIQDNRLLSSLLNQYLSALKDSPLHVSLKELSVDTMIPESVFQRLAYISKDKTFVDDEITPTDYHILFANLLFRYPTVKIWEQNDKKIYFEM